MYYKVSWKGFGKKEANMTWEPQHDEFTVVHFIKLNHKYTNHCQDVRLVRLRIFICYNSGCRKTCSPAVVAGSVNVTATENCKVGILGYLAVSIWILKRGFTRRKVLSDPYWTWAVVRKQQTTDKTTRKNRQHTPIFLEFSPSSSIPNQVHFMTCVD